VRQAFSLAIDRKTIAEQLYGPAGAATSNIVVAPPPVVSANTAFEFNLEKAAALLDEAGWKDSDGDQIRDKDGVKLQIVFQTSVNPVRQKTQEIVKQSLEAIGFGVELKSIDSTVFFNNDPANPDTFKHFYADAQLYTTGSSSPDPGDYLEDFTCAEIVQKANEWSKGNLTRWCNPEYDALVASAKTELDPAKRAQIYIQLNDILINDIVVIPVIHRTFPNGVSNTLGSVVLTPWDGSLWLLKDWVRKSQ
jgi:peptide/nickel transport system substrate-binding protein